MGMDKNSVIGFVILALLFFGYFYYSSQGKQAFEKQQQHIQDSLNRLKPKTDTTLNTANKTDTAATRQDTALQSIIQDSTGKVELVTLENKVLKITFTNKGGQPLKVELKDFKTFNGKSLILLDGQFSNISYPINTGDNETAQTSDLLFTPSKPVTAADGKQTISFSLVSKNGQKIEHQYILSPDDYM